MYPEIVVDNFKLTASTIAALAGASQIEKKSAYRRKYKCLEASLQRVFVLLSLLNNVPTLEAENQLDLTEREASKNLEQLSSGSRINSGADDTAGLAIVDDLDASVAALKQSSENITEGVSLLQTADGALAQITSLLDRSLTLAVEAGNGTTNSSEYPVLFGEYASLRSEIDSISAKTTYNGQPVFGSGSTASSITVFTSDGSLNGSNQFTTSIADTSSSALGLSGGYPTQAGIEYETQAITSAIVAIAAQRGKLGASVEQLKAASAVDQVEAENFQSASSNIRSADVGAVVAHDVKFSLLEQTGISALKQANDQQQTLLQLIR